MAAVVSGGWGWLIACTIIIAALTIIIAIGFLPVDVRNILWWLVVGGVFFVAISWIVIRHSRSKKTEEERRNNPTTMYTRPGDEPRIGHTYEFKDKNEPRASH